MMNETQARADIQSIFANYRALTARDHQDVADLKGGKLYELYVLSEVVRDLAGRGFAVYFVGRTLKFKASPGRLKLSDPHFELATPSGIRLWIFVDIEFRTLGSTHRPVSDRSGYHELDIVVVTATPPNPGPGEIVLGVECKGVAKFGKKLIKEALGVRRELSYVDVSGVQSALTNHGGSPPVSVHAQPPSEFWLAFIDPDGLRYRESPQAFGIELRHITP